MNWYKIAKLTKEAKHVSNESHLCIYCNTNLTLQNFSRNYKHHFPWGIYYICSCGKSKLWTNSVRSEKEFMALVFENKTLKDMPYASGFCNDLFCPLCFSNISILYTGLMMDNQNRPVIYSNNEKCMRLITNYDLFIGKNSKENSQRIDYDTGYMGEKISSKNIIKSIDIQGCQTLEHNIGIISNGSTFEYGEGEYNPIYNEIKNNKNKIPKEMIQEFKNYIER